MDNEYLADEPRAPDLFEGKPPPRIEIKGVAAYVVAYAARSENYRNLDLYYLHAFGSKAAMETIRAFGMEPQGTVLRIEEPAEDEGQAGKVKELKIPPAVRKGWKVHPTVHVDVPGGRVYTTYETVIQHGSVEFNHDPLSKCEWPPEHFVLLARNEEEVPQRFYEKLAARSKLPIHRAFAKPLWDDLGGQGTPYGQKPDQEAAVPRGCGIRGECGRRPACKDGQAPRGGGAAALCRGDPGHPRAGQVRGQRRALRGGFVQPQPYGAGRRLLGCRQRELRGGPTGPSLL